MFTWTVARSPPLKSVLQDVTNCTLLPSLDQTQPLSWGQTGVFGQSFLALVARFPPKVAATESSTALTMMNAASQGKDDAMDVWIEMCNMYTLL